MFYALLLLHRFILYFSWSQLQIKTHATLPHHNICLLFAETQHQNPITCKMLIGNVPCREYIFSLLTPVPINCRRLYLTVATLKLTHTPLPSRNINRLLLQGLIIAWADAILASQRWQRRAFCVPCAPDLMRISWPALICCVLSSVLCQSVRQKAFWPFDPSSLYSTPCGASLWFL